MSTVVSIHFIRPVNTKILQLYREWCLKTKSAMIFIMNPWVKVIAKSHHKWLEIIIHSNRYIILFLHAILCSKYRTHWKQTLITHFTPFFCKGQSFLICQITPIDPWHHANAMYWCSDMIFINCSCMHMGWVGLSGFLWWAPSAKRKDHHGVSSGWSSVWHRSNTGLLSTQYEQIPIMLGVWPFWLTPFFQSKIFWRAYG